MEDIKKHLARIEKDLKPTDRSLQSTKLTRKSNAPSLQKMMAACELINKVRISKGWGVLAPEEAEITATVWIELLDTHGVTASAYGELFRRAVSANAIKRSKGEIAPDVTPEYLLSFWIGSEGLQSEMRGDADDDEQRVNCISCSGTGWKQVGKGKESGVIRCDHK